MHVCECVCGWGGGVGVCGTRGGGSMLAWLRRLARIIFIRRIYGVFGREITKCTVLYGVIIRIWPFLRKTPPPLNEN